MEKDLGSIIGTIFIILFGAAIAYFVPRMIQREGADQGPGDLPIDKWMRILGLIVMIVGVIQAALMIIL